MRWSAAAIGEREAAAEMMFASCVAAVIMFQSCVACVFSARTPLPCSSVTRSVAIFDFDAHHGNGDLPLPRTIQRTFSSNTVSLNNCSMFVFAGTEEIVRALPGKDKV